MYSKAMITFEENKLPYQERPDILARGDCKAFLHASFVYEEQKVRIYYETTGYKRLSSWKEVQAKDLLCVIEKLIQSMELARDYLFFPEEYILSTDSIYLNDEMDALKLIYIPADRKISASKSMENFLNAFGRITTENGRMYLHTLKYLLTAEDIKYEKILYFIDELITEASICNIR